MERMIRFNVFSVFLMLLMLIFFISSCATINSLFTKQELTPAARYYDALVTFNRNVTTYNEIYKLSDKVTQTKWKTQIDPVVKTANSALDAWKVALNTPDAINKEQFWKDMSGKLLTLLISSGILTVE